jgi:hypothetical protein
MKTHRRQTPTTTHTPVQPPWTPFERARIPASEVHTTMAEYGLSEAEVQAALDGEFWLNSRYQVQKRGLPRGQGFPTRPGQADGPWMVWLSIKRRDRLPIFNWREMQRIKNELVGPECEGLQLFPAESRLVDTSNQYHLYCFLSAAVRVPFGFQDRLVMARPGGKAEQRPFEAPTGLTEEG